MSRRHQMDSKTLTTTTTRTSPNPIPTPNPIASGDTPSRSGTTALHSPMSPSDGSTLNFLSTFNYLGSTVSRTGDLKPEIDRRRGLAAAAMQALWRPLWKHRHISLGTKFRVYNAAVVSILLYGAETWPLSNTLAARLDGFDTRCLRRILGVRWFDHLPGTELRQRTQQPPASCGSDAPSPLVRTCPTTPTRPPYTGYSELQPPVRWVEETSGSPRTRWTDVLAKDLALVNITPEEAQGLAQDRPRWREVARLVGSTHIPGSWEPGCGHRRVIVRVQESIRPDQRTDVHPSGLYTVSRLKAVLWHKMFGPRVQACTRPGHLSGSYPGRVQACTRQVYGSRTPGNVRIFGISGRVYGSIRPGYVAFATMAAQNPILPVAGRAPVPQLPGQGRPAVAAQPQQVNQRGGQLQQRAAPQAGPGQQGAPQAGPGQPLRPDPGSRQHLRPDPGSKEHLRPDPGSTSGQTQAASSTSGRTRACSKEHLRPDPGSRQHLRPDPGSRQHLRPDPGSRQHLKSDPGSRQHLKSDPGRRQHLRPDSGSRQHLRPNPGSRQHLKSDPGSRQHLRPDPGSRQHLKSDPGSRQHLRPDPGSRQHLRPDPGSRQHLRPDPGSRQHLRPDPGSTSGRTRAADSTSGRTRAADSTSGRTRAADSTSGRTRAADSTSGRTRAADSTSGRTRAAPQAGPGQQTTPQAGPGQQTAPQVRPGQQTAPEVRPGQQTAPQAGPGQQTASQAGPGQQTASQAGPGQQTAPQVRPGQQTAPEVRPGQQTAPQAGPWQQTAPQAGPGQQTAPQAGPGQQTAPQAGPGQQTAPQAGPGQQTALFRFSLSAPFLLEQEAKAVIVVPDLYPRQYWWLTLQCRAKRRASAGQPVLYFPSRSKGWQLNQLTGIYRLFSSSGCAISLHMAGASDSQIMSHVGWFNNKTASYYMKLAQVMAPGGPATRLASEEVRRAVRSHEENNELLLSLKEAFPEEGVSAQQTSQNCDDEDDRRSSKQLLDNMTRAEYLESMSADGTWGDAITLQASANILGKKWVTNVKRNKESTKDEHRSGRPKISTTDNPAQATHDMVVNDRPETV
ncbi:hypothetical protein Bbelb_334420 [Branchiostoma belcheri]|nr:hypothetical protein Bbelb_334420 [Branchiostoma belcheri]